mgnify:CR=1 FL=1|jgi:hypothetical protein
MSYLVFINGLGPNYKGDNMYEFIFSEEVKDIWDESWEAKPSNGYPKPPELDYIKKVGVLKNTSIELELIQNSDFFSFMDSMDGVVALGWEKESENIDFTNTKRLVFHFGETEQEIKNKLYERDVVLEFEKKVVYEN